jgi:hypothetical protein
MCINEGCKYDRVVKRALLTLFISCWIGFTAKPENVSQPTPQRGAATANMAGEAAGNVPNSPRPEPALPALLNLFDEHQVVGLSDLHGCAELLAFVEELVQAPEFAAKVNDITWEPGNARFQGLMDDFIVRGREVPFRLLSQCWRSNTQANTYGDTPALFNLLNTIRTVNLKLPEGRRVRVLLIDPPVDWDKIHSNSDLRKEDFYRETHMADILEREVYAKGRKALFFAGGAHLGRGSVGPSLALPKASARLVLIPFEQREGKKPGAALLDSMTPVEDVIACPERVEAKLNRGGDEPVQRPFGRSELRPALEERGGLQSEAGVVTLSELASPLQTIERRHPGTTFNITVHEGFGNRTDELEARLVAWPRPALAQIRGTWWGELTPPASGDVFIGPDGKPVEPDSNRRIHDKWDAVLFLGKRKELTRVDPPGPDTLDADWMSELRRRQAILGGPPRSPAHKERPHSRRYFSD